MSTVDEVVTSVIEIKDAAVSQDGFGVPLIAAAHSFWPERVREFSDPDELLLTPLNVPATHSVYLKAAAIKAQKPSPSTFKIGKRLGVATQIVVLTPSTPAANEKYSLVIDGIAITVTADGTPLLSEVTAALAAAIGTNTTVPGLSATSSATEVTVTATPATTGARHSFEELSSNLKLKETTANPAIALATDLAAIRSADAGWYGLFLDSSSEEEVKAAAAWAETQRVLFMPTLYDSEIKDGAVTTDVGSDLKTAGYKRTIPIFHEKPHTQSAGAAWGGRMLPKAPGSANWANKSLAGVDKSSLSDGERAALKAKNVNYYVDVKGIGFTLDGRSSGGRYADITHGMDWFESRTEERIIAMLANNDKIPYTDNGGELIRAQVVAQILEAIGATVIDGDQSWSVTVPVIATINPNDKLNREFPNVKYSFVLQGAVNKVRMNGTVLIAL